MNIEESLNFLVKAVTEIRAEILDLKVKSELKAYTLSEIAVGLGYKVQTMRNHPWKIPCYGKPDEGKAPGRWFYKTIRDWYDIPEDERRQKWESMSSVERREKMGKKIIF
jgi:hypothetical protein